MILIHTQTCRMTLLQRVILQIYKNKEKAFSNIRQGTVTIYAKTVTVITTFTCNIHTNYHHGMPQKGKQMGKLTMIQASQGTETFRVILCSVYHILQMYMHTRYITNLIYIKL